MLGLKEVKNDLSLINSIDWDMTPEEAVRLYLEWGNNWSGGTFVKSKEDTVYYFVLNCWESNPVIYLVKRNSDGAVDLAKFEVPESVNSSTLKNGCSSGVWAIDEEIKFWLQKELDR